MKRIFNIVVLSVILNFVLINCNKATETSSDTIKGIKFFSRGPGECVYIISLNMDGKGNLVRGKSKQFYREPFKTLYQKKISKNFIISGNQLDSIKILVARINKNVENRGGFSTDVSRKELYIDGKKKIDIYSWKNKDIYLLEKYLTPFIPVKINPFCE